MNGKDILIALSYIDPKYIEAAQSPPATAKRRIWKRPVLIAAMIGLMLVLVGCAAAVYLLKTEDMQVTQVVETQPMFADVYGFEYIGMEEVPNQILSVNGIQGTPAYQANLEWFEFTQVYDADHEILNSVWADMPTFPPQYDAFRVYSQEMADKIDEIAAKYDLKLPGEGIPVGEPRKINQVLGIDGILVPDSGGLTAPNGAFTVFENGNIHTGLLMRVDPDKVGWSYPMVNSFYFLKKGYFDPYYIAQDHPEEWEEWNYTTESGCNVLLLYSSTSLSRAAIICDRADATIVMEVEIVYSTEIEKGRDNWPRMTKRQLEQVADAINFGIEPQIDMELARQLARKD